MKRGLLSDAGFSSSTEQLYVWNRANVSKASGVPVGCCTLQDSSILIRRRLRVRVSSPQGHLGHAGNSSGRYSAPDSVPL